MYWVIKSEVEAPAWRRRRCNAAVSDLTSPSYWFVFHTACGWCGRLGVREAGREGNEAHSVGERDLTSPSCWFSVFPTPPAADESF